LRPKLGTEQKKKKSNEVKTFKEIKVEIGTKDVIILAWPLLSRQRLRLVSSLAMHHYLLLAKHPKPSRKLTRKNHLQLKTRHTK
jgi:hypothetical protein